MRRSVAVLALATFLSLPAGMAEAQPAYLVRDLQPEPPELNGVPGSAPTPLLAARGRLYFTAFEGSSGRELWVTDGTAANTQLLVDACPGGCDSRTEIVGTANGLLFFVAETEENGDRVLWRSDGTRRGTFVLAPGGSPLAVDTLFRGSAILGNGVLVSACSEPVGCGLWKSDGSAAGTTRLMEAEEFFQSSIVSLVAAGNRAFFTVGGEFTAGPAELWRSDGTAGGTVRIEVIGDNAHTLIAAGSQVFFFGENDALGVELWRSDGTEAGTLPLTQFPRDPGPRWIKVLGSRAYFAADDVTHGDEVWSSDGTPAGTRRFTDFGFASPIPGESTANQIEQLGSQILFVATDGLSGLKLWSRPASATNAGAAVPLASLCPEADRCDIPASYFRLLKVGSRLFFPAYDAAHGLELWSTDGTARGTRLMRDVCAGPCGSFQAGSLLSFQGAALFLGESDSPTDRYSLWRSDGTPEGTKRFARVGSNSFNFGTAELAGALFYPASPSGDASGLELWRSDGTPAGTRLVADLARSASSSSPFDLAALGSHLFFFACVDDRNDLWRTGGNRGEATKIIAEGSGFCRGRRRFPLSAVSGDRLYFWRSGSPHQELWQTREDGVATLLAASRSFSGEGNRRLVPYSGGVAFEQLAEDEESLEVWTSDGTPAGTHKAFDLPPGLFLESDTLQAAGGELYFLAGPPDVAPDLWRSDGTPAGTRALTAGGLFFEKLRVGRTPTAALFFAHTDSPNIGELWRTNGTAAGTEKVKEGFLDRFQGPYPTVPVAFQGAGYFLATRHAGSATEEGLWRSDGTEAGTVLVKSLVLNDDFDSPDPQVTLVGGKLYFVADDGVHGRELWASDGSTAGTVLVRELAPGAQHALITELRGAAGRLWMEASDGLNGFELWTSDGTAAGTRMVQDLAPQALSSYPSEPTAAGDRLFWSADDGLSGRELWALPLAGTGSCQAEAEALCLGGRFKVEAAWQDPAGNRGTGRAVGLTADTGYFWFFNDSNVEVVIKVLDGVGVNGHHWVFYGALSDVEYTLTVTDSQTGLTRRYLSPRGRLASVADTTAFGPLGAFSAPAPAGLASAPAGAIVTREGTAEAQGGSKAACVESPTRLCLNGGRFAVEATWKLPGQPGTASAVRLTGDTGYLWFFSASNVEVVVKVLDGRPVNGKFWVFAGALSGVEYRITVTDTQTGKVKTYDHPAGPPASFADTAAF